MKSILKMKKVQTLSRTLLFALLMSVAFVGCSKDDNGSSEVAKDDNQPNEEHSFDITLVNTIDESETITFSRTVPTEEGNALYRDRTISGERDHSITMLIGELDEPGSVFGILDLQDNKRPFPTLRTAIEQEGCMITIRPEGTDDYYTSVSGTVNFSNLKYVFILSSGAACFTLEFEGLFAKNSIIGDGEATFHGTGTIVISPEKDMGVYKEL